MLYMRGDKKKFEEEFPERGCVIRFPETQIAPRSTAHVVTYPPFVFRPRRLVVDRSYPTLRVLDFKVGKNSQSVAPGSYPMDVLGVGGTLACLDELLGKREESDIGRDEVAREVDKLCDNLGSVDTCQAGMNLVLSLRNDSDEPVTWSGRVRGDRITEEPKLTRQKTKSEVLLPLTAAVIPPGKTVDVDACPQLIFKPRSLTTERAYPSLRVTNLRVGGYPQSTILESYPIDTFLLGPTLERVRQILGERGQVGEEETAARLEGVIDNLGDVDTCQIGMIITLSIRNTGDEAVTFEGGLFRGTSIW
jgi:hypothetical protein